LTETVEYGNFLLASNSLAKVPVLIPTGDKFTMNVIEKKAQAGFSLVEMTIVLTVIAVLTTFALLQFRTSKVDLERQAIAREFKVYLERARFDSVRRRAEGADQATLTLTSASSFTVRMDFDGDGDLAAHEARIVDFSQKSQTLILVSDSFNYPLQIRFDRRGHVQTADGLGNEVDPVFTICSNCTDADPDRSVLTVSATGTVAATRDIPDPTTFPEPIITDPPFVPNCYIYLASSNSNSSVPCPL
jgi:prepilin-type N-terminal cleavage/methylation domain-containing protein